MLLIIVLYYCSYAVYHRGSPKWGFSDWGLCACVRACVRVCVLTDGHRHLRAWIRFMEQLLPHFGSQELKVAVLSRSAGRQGQPNTPLLQLVNMQDSRKYAQRPPNYNKMAAVWRKQQQKRLLTFLGKASTFKAAVLGCVSLVWGGCQTGVSGSTMVFTSHSPEGKRFRTPWIINLPGNKASSPRLSVWERGRDKSTQGRWFESGSGDGGTTLPAALLHRRPQISQLTWHHPLFPPNARFYVACVCHYPPYGTWQGLVRVS